MKGSALFVTLILGISMLPGCVKYEDKRGVDVNWQAEVTDTLIKGTSTRIDVMALLGPPSQVIALEGESVFYYLFEHAKGEGLILIVYNRTHINTKYDRAIFFFDENDVLSEYSTRISTNDL
jgi:outer membrane protein assembly factor BamE (lipoprotein component of BamABCDE complex)